MLNMLEYPQMSAEKYFLEAWLSKGVHKPESFESVEIPHAHITFIRPFTIPEGNEEVVKEKIINYCKSNRPIPFIMAGEGNFNGEISYIPVKGVEIEKFDSDIEGLLASDVQFVEKLGEKKILHLTISTERVSPFPETKLFMLRLTCIRDRRVWFSFDFTTQEVLNREESLDEVRWVNTLNTFSQQKS